jgi:hypothetical protein
MIKTYQLSIKQRTQQKGRKRYKMEGPNPGKLKIFQRGHITRGTRRNKVIKPSPPIVKKI